jgi:hypothetical protein
MSQEAMVAAVRQQIDYASAGATRPRRRLPRWVAVVAAALGLTYLIFLVIIAATDPQPARAARILARENAYAALIAGASGAGYFAVRRRDASRARPTSFLAVFSAGVAVLNPALVGLFFGALGVRGIGGGGDAEMYSVVTAVAALAAGIIAAVRIRRSRGLLSGMRLAIVGIVVAGVWVAFWIAFALSFAARMAGFR